MSDQTDHDHRLDEQLASRAGMLRIVSQPQADGAIVLTLRGEIDIASAPALEQAIRDAESPRCECIVFDLAGVGFIDSTGLGVLLRTQQRAHEAGRRMVLASPQGQVRRIFSVTGLVSRFTIT